MEQIRSFIAYELPPEVKAELASLEERLKQDRHPFVKWVEPEGIHLTLKFLGNIAPAKVPRIVEATTRASRKVYTLHLQLGELGAFPSLKGLLDYRSAVVDRREGFRFTLHSRF